MKNVSLSDKLFRGPFKFIGKSIENILKYLACHECETPNDGTSLRNLYNRGHIDEGTYHQMREKCWKESFDPEEMKTPM